MTSADPAVTGAVCVDANIVIGILTDSSGPADSVWRSWRRDRIHIMAPSLLPFEVTNGVYRSARARREPPEDVLRIIAALPRLGVGYTEAATLSERAVRMAHRFALPATYDAYYLALAESLGVQLWTLDKGLHNSVSPHLPWVVLAGATA